MASSRSTSQSRLQLTAEEMRDISQDISRTFAPRRFRTGGRAATSGFSPQELFGISQQISREFAPRADMRAPGAPSLVLLPVDPRRLHAYWQLPEPSRQARTDVQTQSPAASETGLTLRIYRQPEATANVPEQAENRPEWFDLPVSGQSSQQQIALPELLSGNAGYYQAAIGHLDQYREFTALAYSNPAAVAETASAETWLAPVIAQFVLPVSAGSPAGSAALAGCDHE